MKYTHRDRGICKYTQVALQEWKEGKIVREVFYYGT